jgi:hypothetical protein
VTPGTQCQQPVSGCGWGWDDDLGTVDAAGVGMMTWARWARSARGLRCMGAHAGMMGGGREIAGWTSSNYNGLWVQMASPTWSSGPH